MTLEEGLYSHLVNDSGVAALVSTRVYPLLVPQDTTLPAIAYQRISGPRDHTHSGASGLALARMQVSCLGNSYGQAKQVSEAVRAALDGLRGSLGAVSADAVFLDNERDEWSTAFEEAVVQQDYLIWYQEG